MVFKRPSRTLEGEKGEFNSHRKTKIFAYRMARRLLRKGNRKIRSGHGGDSGLMEMQMVFGAAEEDEGVRAERLGARQENNREWRRAREVARWASCGLEAPPSPTTGREAHRLEARRLERELFHLLLCSSCGAQVLPEAWQCPGGHLTCGLCFDETNMGKDVEEEEEEEESLEGERRDVVAALRRSLTSMTSREASVASIDTVTSIVTMAGLREELTTLAEQDEGEELEHKSFSKYRIDEIDFFLNTIEVRGDAISCYVDYNNEGRTIFYDPDIEALKIENEGKEVEEEKEEDDIYKDEKTSRIHTFMRRLREKGSVASVRETLVDIVGTAGAEVTPSWAKYRLTELDFFLDSADVRKEAISYYGDYNNQMKSIFERASEEEAVASWSESSGSSRSSVGPGASLGEGPRVTRCAACTQFIVERNLQVERTARIFFHV